MRFVVTGGSGFIGSNLIEMLRARGASGESWDIAPPRNSALGRLWRPVDVCDQQAVEREMRRFRPTHIVHLAARTDLRGTTEDCYRVNVAGTASILAATRTAASVER